LSGKKNSFTASLYPTNREKDILYCVSGQWTKTFDIVEGPSKKGTIIDTHDAEATPKTALIVPPIEVQDPLESRRAWAKVAAGIAEGNMEVTGIEKTKIEVAQREMRAQERAEGRTWERRYFSQVEDDPTLDSLAHHINLNPEPEKTGGIWRFDEAKHNARAIA